jgi:hypothetical protein
MKKPLKLLSEADYASDTTDAEWSEIEPHRVMAAGQAPCSASKRVAHQPC